MRAAHGAAGAVFWIFEGQRRRSGHGIGAGRDYVQSMKVIRRSAAICALSLCAFLATPSPHLAAEESERLLPNREELRALGDLAERMMREFADDVTPMVERLQGLMQDLDAYEAPEMLPNGDIIIRRRTDIAPDTAPSPAPRRDQAPADDGSVAL